MAQRRSCLHRAAAHPGPFPARDPPSPGRNPRRIESPRATPHPPRGIPRRRLDVRAAVRAEHMQEELMQRISIAVVLLLVVAVCGFGSASAGAIGAEVFGAYNTHSMD